MHSLKSYDTLTMAKFYQFTMDTQFLEIAFR